MRVPRVQHLPQHPVSSHFYSGGTVLPSTGTLCKTEPGQCAPAKAAGAAWRRDRAYGCSVSDAVGSHVTPYTLHASKSHFSSDAKHPVDGSLGPEEGSLHFKAVPASTWFRLPSEACRAFHGDGVFELVSANATHNTRRDLKFDAPCRGKYATACTRRRQAHCSFSVRFICSPMPPGRGQVPALEKIAPYIPPSNPPRSTDPERFATVAASGL